MAQPRALAGRHAAMQAYQRLQAMIRRGILPLGGRLPAERELAASLEVSRVTLRHALAQLEREGQVERPGSRGWFVAPGAVGEPPSVLQSFTAMTEARGLTATATVVCQQLREATEHEAAQLTALLPLAVVELTRVRGMSGMAVCVDTEVVIADRAPGLVDAAMQNASLYGFLASAGVRVVRSSCTLLAASADQQVAAHLGIAPGVPVLVSRSVSYDENDAPVMAGTTVYRGDAYRFHADLYASLGAEPTTH